MSDADDSEAIRARRLGRWLERAGLLWLLGLPLLRPLIWSGDPTDLPNLLYLILLAGATATGLMLRGLQSGSPRQRSGLPAILGSAFLALMVVGALHSPLPARAWTLVCVWALHLAAPWALMPLIARHPAVVFSGLVAGLLGEGAVLLGQQHWERPDLQQSFLADPALVAQTNLSEQYATRITSWRLEGSFLLANTLAAYLITLWPLLAAATLGAWRARAPGRAMLTLALAVASVALAASGSKAGILCLALAVSVTLVLILPRWRVRGCVAAALVVALAGALCVPAVRTHAWASLEVRIDYWRAAVALIEEHPFAGCGLEGFGVNYPRVKLARAEDTTIAHQEVLQAACDCGIPAAALLVGWWAVLLVRLRPRPLPASAPPSATEPQSTEPQSAAAGALPWGLVAGTGALIGFAVLFVGVLHVNFLAYPGGREGAALLWGVGLVAFLTVVLAGLRRLPAPSPAACFCGVLACLLHALADFHLHSAQVVGVLAMVAVLGLATGRAPRPGGAAAAIPEPEPQSPRRQWAMVLSGTLVLLMVTAGVMAAALRDDALERGRRSEDALRRAALARLPSSDEQTRERARIGLDDELERHGIINDDDLTVGVFALTSALNLIGESERFPRDNELSMVAAGILTYGAELSPATFDQLNAQIERLALAWPGQIAYAKCVADQRLHLALRARDAQAKDAPALAVSAQRAAEAVVALYPSCLHFREGLVVAARLAHDEPTAAREIAVIRALQDEVYYTSRPHRRW
jgi:O-Antigen ligase